MVWRAQTAMYAVVLGPDDGALFSLYSRAEGEKMEITDELRTDIDNLELWVLTSFMRQMGRSHGKDIIDQFDVHLRAPKDDGGVFSVLIVSKHRDDFLRILVYVDKFEQYLDSNTGFVLTQEQNYGPGTLDEVWVSYATISKIKYPHLYKFTASRKYLETIADTNFELTMEDGGSILLEDGSGSLLQDSRIVV